MSTVAKPIIKQIKDNRDALDFFEKNELSAEDKKTQEIIKYFPTVYIHNWEKSGDYEVYVGESNDVFRRTKEHYDAASNPKNWQSKLLKNNAKLFLIGHEHFNKSLTLDIENRLMHYLMSVKNVKKVHNLRDNPQTSYYPMEELDEIFRKIWRGLRKENKELFPPESVIKGSAVFKASPLHKLTEEQLAAKDTIIKTTYDALENGSSNQIVFVDGEAGTGKTVLMSSAFYELYCLAEENNKQINAHLLVNHDEQLPVYEEIAEKLGLTDKYGHIVSKPTSFINSHDEGELVDVVFIDEAHLLLTQGKQSYKGKNHLADIMKRARVTVVMFDENQILTTEQFWEAEILESFRNMAKASNTHIVLNKQLRMHADECVIDWIDSFTKEHKVNPIPKNTDYEIKVFDTIESLDYSIISKAKNSDTSLSRLIATFDWKYSSTESRYKSVGLFWEVAIGNWHKPWNREKLQALTQTETKAINNKKLSWAEQEHTIDEVGSTFTIQGFDLNYAGVILGPSVTYRDGRIVINPKASKHDKAIRNRTLSDGSKKKFGEILINNAVRVLMTRGVNGLYIYACDEELRKALKEAAK